MRSLLALLPILLFAACGEDPKADKMIQPVQETEQVREIDTVPDRIKETTELHDSSGAAGVFAVDKMLALTLRDSAGIKDMAFRMSQAFTHLQNDMNELGIKPAGASGCITYNDDPLFTIFECIVPIDSIPKKKPRFSRVAVIKGEDMLVYNHYGDYSKINESYLKIQKIMKKQGLLKTGPLREFYITDPTRVKDKNKWLTRILVPVMKKSPSSY